MAHYLGIVTICVVILVIAATAATATTTTTMATSAAAVTAASTNNEVASACRGICAVSIASVSIFQSSRARAICMKKRMNGKKPFIKCVL